MHQDRTVYLNGNYLHETQARISIFDRGFLFSDAVYEVTCIVDGRLLDFDAHMARLKRSLTELDMAMPLSRDEFLALHRELVGRNGIAEGLVYLQISRGNAGDRDFVFSTEDLTPTIVAFTQQKNLTDAPYAREGLRILSFPDLRWGRRDIKTTQLLFPSLVDTRAHQAGADEAWLVQNGHVTEGASHTAYIVKNGEIVTRALSYDILPGITRATLLRFAAESGMKIVERNFTIAEAQSADEAFITSATRFVTPVIEIDGVPIGDGRPGPAASRLRALYIEEIRKFAI